jgi:hypothetical protein
MFMTAENIDDVVEGLADIVARDVLWLSHLPGKNPPPGTF